MISAQNLSKHYVNQVIFDNVSFNISTRERVGLVGRNGYGKTTLFNLITGQERCDEGSISIPKDYRIGHLNQYINFTKPTVLEEGCCGLSDDQNGEEWKVQKALSGLGFSEEDFSRNPAEFSGGYQMRINLAKVLVSEPNILLLDEPTNFLDIISIRWLTEFLNAWQNEVIIISHDRGFMDCVTTHILGIHRYKIRKIKGSTQDYYDQIAKEEDIYEKKRLNTEKKRKHTERFITRFRAKARLAGLAQSRIKSLEKQEKLEKLGKITNLSFSFNSAPFTAKQILDVRDITFSYDNNRPYLIDKLNITVENRDRICVIGKNGKGKTTLLKLLAGELSPLEGEVKKHPQSKTSYFEQANTAKLRNENTIEDEIMSCVPDMEKKTARDICGAMMFSGDTALKKIATLSGGEKCRVLLGKLLAAPSSLLLLDEPTHHLDMEACNEMTEAIGAFEGAAIIVTHNEYVLHSIANKLIVFQGGKVFQFLGGYSSFLEQIGWDDEADFEHKESQNKPQNKPKRNDDKRESRKARAEFFTRRSKTLRPFEKKIEEIENNIEKIEQQYSIDNQSLIKASEDQDVSAITVLSKSIKQARTRIDFLYNELEKSNEEHEQLKLQFEQDENSF